MFCTCSDLACSLLVDACNLLLLCSRLANMGAMHVAPGAGSAGREVSSLCTIIQCFVAALFPVDLVTMNKV